MHGQRPLLVSNDPELLTSSEVRDLIWSVLSKALQGMFG
jgi:hypothetical protein